MPKRNAGYGAAGRVNILKKVKVRTTWNFYPGGFRDKELRFLTWRDVDFRNHALRVTAKPQYDFEPKNKEEREVPVPESLLDLLKAHKERQHGHPTVLYFQHPAERQTRSTTTSSKNLRTALV
jgi:integrase